MLPPPAISKLFPPFVVQHMVRWSADEAPDLGDPFLGISLPAALARAVPARQREFLAGRFCAREALSALAPQHAKATLAIGKDRAPIWPAGIVGTITHTGGIAAAAVARTSDARAIGFDAEVIMEAGRAESILEHLADSDELAAVARAGGFGSAAALTAIFSAKETIFKCLYAEVGRYFGFREVRIEAFGDGAFSAVLLSALAPALPAGTPLHGTFSSDGSLLWTAMVLPPTAGSSSSSRTLRVNDSGVNGF